MCDFPSWIKTPQEEIVFLTDKEVEGHLANTNNDICWADWVGHSAIEKLYPCINGESLGGFPCPTEVAIAIREGRMQKMAAAAGFMAIHVNTLGQLHRTDGPAIEQPDGTRIWYQNGQRHRTDGPAVERPNGTRIWYQNGQIYRTNGPAIEWPDG